jgi:hypothetical protein
LAHVEQSAALADGRARQVLQLLRGAHVAPNTADGDPMHPKLALIAMALSGWTEPPFASSTICFVDGDPPPEGGKTKMFTQEEVNALIQDRVGRETRSFEKKLTDATKSESEKAAALEQKLAELTARFEDAGKSGAEKELAQLRRELQLAAQQKADFAKERDTLVKERDEASAKHRSQVVSTRLQSELAAAKILPTALSKAVRLAEGEAKIELDTEGKLSINWNNRVYTDADVSKFAKDFATENPFLAAHPGGGTGTRVSNNGGLSTDPDKHVFGSGFAALAKNGMTPQGE